MRAVNFPGMRNINRSVVLDLIRRHGPISRGEIARRSQLAPSAVTNIVNELIALGLVRVGSLAESSGGRPAVLLELVPDAFQVVGVNVGFTNIVAVLSDLRGQPLARATLPTCPDQSPEEVLQRVAKAIVRAIADFVHSTPPTTATTTVTAALTGRAQVTSQLRLAGIGVGIPGLVDTRRGYSIFSPNLHWHDVPVRSILAQALQAAEQEQGLRHETDQEQTLRPHVPATVPIYIDNDVRAATLGESMFGAGDGSRNLVALFVGSAIGAGLILDGQLYYGANETAGEIGHIRVTEDGPLCSCGNYGCLEAVASGRAIARKAARLLKQGYPFTHLPQLTASPDDVTAADVARAATAGDAEAARIMQEAARHIGIAVSFLVNTLNPERIVIGGGVSRAGEMLLEPIRQTVLTHAMPVARNRVQIVSSRLGSDAGPLGAAALVMDRLFPPIRLAESELLA